MKSLSIRQPWASMIAVGEKTIEVRSWPTKYRGPLLVCAAKRKCGNLPTGIALAVVDVVDCRPLRKSDSKAAGFSVTDPDGYYAWILSAPRPIKPIPVLGRLGLFDVDAEIRYEPVATQ